MVAYTGRDITWDEVLKSDLQLGPGHYELGEVAGVPEKAPVKGTPPTPVNRYH